MYLETGKINYVLDSSEIYQVITKRQKKKFR